MNRQANVKTTRDRRSARNEQKPLSPWLRILRDAGIGNLIASAIGLLLLLLMAGVVSAQSDPNAFLLPASLAALAIASLLCGVTAERISGAEPVPLGITAGALWILFGFLLSLTVGNGVGALTSVYAFALRIPQFLLVLLGAFLAKSRPRKVSSRRRR